MGCCFSTPTPTVDQSQPPKTTTATSQPPPLEEETVKEVLSETPILPKQPISQPILQKQPISQPIIQPITQNDVVEAPENDILEIHENVSEISEMYSYSESFSAATTTTTVTVADNKKDDVDEDEVTQKVKKNSPPAKKVVRKQRPVVTSGEMGVRKERMGRRQMAPSPEKIRHAPAVKVPPRYRNDGRREVTARRSRSPAVRGETHGEKGGRGKVMEKSGGKLSEVVAVKKVDDGGGLTETEMVTEVTESESLENPLVSLECFIFL